MNLIFKIKNNRRLVRFGLVGIINTILDFGLLFLFRALGIPVEIANIMSTGTAFIFSFYANKKYTFKTTDTNIIYEMTLFILVTLSGLWILQTGIIAILQPPITTIVKRPNLALLIAKLIGTAASLTWNYILYSRFVFKKSST